MDSPGRVDRWIAFELGRLNAGLVVEKKSLARLLGEASPACRTREADEHPFDRAVLERLAGVLMPAEADALAAKALRDLEKFDRAFPFRDGRMIVPHSLAVDIVRRLGGAVQLAFG